MSNYPVYPSGLAGAEMALVRFDLDLLTACTLHLDNLLGLRSRLQRAAEMLPPDRRSAIFDPLISSDPASVRRYQKPAPSFVMRSVESLAGEHLEGDPLQLEILFLGNGTLVISDFLAVLQNLGRRGLVAGGGQFDINSARCRGIDGRWRHLWRDGQREVELMPELLGLDQWLDWNWPKRLPLIFELNTPARLVAGGRVLRQPRFVQIFPFMLRRVSSMLHAHCALEAVEPQDLDLLFDAASRIEGVWLENRWIDWREVDVSGTSDKSVGGLTGRMRLNGTGVEDLLWIVMLATLFGIGKGAPYGAGSCRLAFES